MTGLNILQAEQAAMQGYAVRRDAWTWWLVYRHFGWYKVTFGAASEQWFDLVNTDLGLSETGAKDWTTKPWAGGTLPACAQPGQPTSVPDGGSFGDPQLCGAIGLIAAATTPTDGTDQSGLSGLELRLLYMTVTARPAYNVGGAGLPDGITIGPDGSGGLGFTTFPPDYVGAVGIQAVFIHDGSSVRPVRCYAWLRNGARPAGDMSAPFDYYLDRISKLASALGPVLATDTLLSDAQSTEIQAGHPLINDSADTLLISGRPVEAFASVPMQPGDTIWGRIDALKGDGSRETFYASTTLPGWVNGTTIITVGAAASPETDSTHMVRDPGVDGIMGTLDDDPDGDPGLALTPLSGDELMMSAVCYTAPGDITITVTFSVVGGKPLSTSASAMTINGVDVTPTMTDAHHGSGTLTGAFAGLTIAYTVAWTQPADTHGPAVDAGSAGGSIIVAPAC